MNIVASSVKRIACRNPAVLAPRVKPAVRTSARDTVGSLAAKRSALHATPGFTLIETMVAISLLVISIAAPMSLAIQSLSSAFYARDQVTAFHLAQEAIEAVRAVRDGNALRNVQGAPTDLMTGIPDTSGQPFIIDTRTNDMERCTTGTCPELQTNGELYGYSDIVACSSGTCPVASPWQDTRFTRTVRATFIGGGTDEVRLRVEVKWRTGKFQERTTVIIENLYRWIPDGTI